MPECDSYGIRISSGNAKTPEAANKDIAKKSDVNTGTLGKSNSFISIEPNITMTIIFSAKAISNNAMKY